MTSLATPPAATPRRRSSAGAGSASPRSSARSCSPDSRSSRSTCSTLRSPGPTPRCPGSSRSSPSRRVGAGPTPRHAADAARPRRRHRPAEPGLRRRLARPARRELRAGLDRRHRRGHDRRRAAPRRRRPHRHRCSAAGARRPALGWRLAHGAGWLAAVPVFALLAVMPFVIALMTTHAPRWEIQESSLGIPHQEVTIATTDGRAVRLVRPVPQSHGRAPQPRFGRQPRAAPRTCACSPATATACSHSTTPATARATATPTASAPTPSRPSTPPSLARPATGRGPAADRRVRHLARRRGAARGRGTRAEAARGRGRRVDAAEDAHRAGDPTLLERVSAGLDAGRPRHSGMREPSHWSASCPGSRPGRCS